MAFVMFSENVLCVPVMLYKLVKKKALQVHLCLLSILLNSVVAVYVRVYIDNIHREHLIYWPSRFVHIVPENRLLLCFTGTSTH